MPSVVRLTQEASDLLQKAAAKNCRSYTQEASYALRNYYLNQEADLLKITGFYGDPAKKKGGK